MCNDGVHSGLVHVGQFLGSFRYQKPKHCHLAAERCSLKHKSSKITVLLFHICRSEKFRSTMCHDKQHVSLNKNKRINFVSEGYVSVMSDLNV